MTDRIALPRIAIFVAVVRRQRGGIETVGDLHEEVGVRALITTGANCRGHGVNRHDAVTADLPRDAAAAARGWVKRRRVVRYTVRHADIQAILQNVLHLPEAVHALPLLHAGSSEAGSVGHIPVDRGTDQRSIALIADVQRVFVGEPNSERKGDRCRRAGR